MGISVPSINLKKWSFLNLASNTEVAVTINLDKYLWLTSQDLTEMDELVFAYSIHSFINIEAALYLVLNRSTTLWTSGFVENAESKGTEFIDVSTRNGAYLLGLRLVVHDLGGMPNDINMDKLQLWGKLAD